MGGFTVDGCGATDKFYPIMSLGTHVCPSCNKTAEFTLDEVKRKISVFYIPTATVSVKYAIMCKSCERGSYISEAEKNGILSGNLTVNISKEGIAVQTKASQADVTNNQSRTTLHDNSSSNASAITKVCPECGSVLQENAMFCWKCGCDLAESITETKTQVCPKCNNELQETAMFCWKCGYQLAEQPHADDYDEDVDEIESNNTDQLHDEAIDAVLVNSVEQDPISVELPQKKFCPKCNMFYVKTKEKCTICGGELILK